MLRLSRDNLKINMNVQIKEVKKTATESFGNKQWAINDKKFNFLPSRKTFYFASYSGKEIIAYAQVEIRGGIAEIRSLLVKDGLRGSGVGTQLFSHVEAWAKIKKNCVKSVVKTSSAWPKTIHFYKKMGYKKDAVLPKYYYGVDWYYLSKNL